MTNNVSGNGSAAQHRRPWPADRAARRRHSVAHLWRYALLRRRYRALRVGFFAVERGASIGVAPQARLRFGRGIHLGRDFSGSFIGQVSIGHNVYFDRGCYVVARHALSIGDNCYFAEMVTIHDENHIVGRGPQPVAARGFTEAPVVIGHNVWVGPKATILQGVHIGDNAVIGANAVVTRDIPANAVATGIPARVTGEWPCGEA